MTDKKQYRTATQIKRIAFFRGLLEKSKGKTDLFLNISPESGYYATISKSAGISGIRFTYWKPLNEGNIELLIEKSNPEENKAIFDYLFKHKDEIEKIFDEPLEWEPCKGSKRTAIRKRFSGGDLNSPGTWPTIQDKMIDAMIKFEKAFRPWLNNIKIGIQL